jgi:hypothetical protein
MARPIRTVSGHTLMNFAYQQDAFRNRFRRGSVFDTSRAEARTIDLLGRISEELTSKRIYISPGIAKKIVKRIVADDFQRLSLEQDSLIISDLIRTLLLIAREVDLSILTGGQRIGVPANYVSLTDFREKSRGVCPKPWKC